MNNRKGKRLKKNIKLKMKNSNAITLIALVVTIIVLIILAGVSMSFILGENGIIKKAQNSRLQSEIGKEKETIALAYNAAKIYKLGETVVANDMNEQLESNRTKATAEDDTNNVIKVTFYETERVYTIYENGQITGPTEIGVLEVPIKYEYSFNAGYKDGKVTDDIKVYLVRIEGETDDKGEPVYEMLFIGSGEMASAMEWDTDIFDIYMVSAVETLGYNKSIKNVKISHGITNISYRAFQRCSYLSKITIPPTVKSIDEEAFQYCGLTSIEIPSSVITIGRGAFSYCTKLTNITICEGVANIDEEAFYESTALKSIIIPSSVTNIGGNAFAFCEGLTNVIISEGVANIESGVFYECKGLTSIEIPNSVMIINGYTFYGCTNLKSIIIPNTVTSIGEKAFEGCKGLKSIIIPNSVTNIGRSAFSGCGGLTSIKISNSLTNIGGGVFYACSGLTTIEIPSSVTNIGENAFAACRGLTSIEIPTSVTSIEYGAFQSCTNLANIELQNNKIIIGGDAFYGTKWYGAQGNGDVYINNIYYEYKGTMPENTTIKIKEGTTSIVSYAFSNREELTCIIIPTSVTHIGHMAFGGYKGGLKTVNYTGTKEQWNQILIEDDNEYLTNATINYEYTE